MNRNPHLAGRGLRQHSEIDRAPDVAQPDPDSNVLPVARLELLGGAS